MQLVGRCDLVDAEAVDGMELEHQPVASRERGERCPEGALELAPIAQLQVIQLGIGARCGWRHLQLRFLSPIGKPQRSPDGHDAHETAELAAAGISRQPRRPVGADN